MDYCRTQIVNMPELGRSMMEDILCVQIILKWFRIWSILESEMMTLLDVNCLLF